MQLAAIRSLVEAAKKLGAGDLSARADMAAWQAPEFRALADTLGDMAKGIARAHADLASSESQLRLLAENSTDMILLVREDGRCLYASPACRALLGYSPEEMLKISSKDAIHPRTSPRCMIGASGATATRRPRPIACAARTAATSGSRASGGRSPRRPDSRIQRVVVVRDIDRRLAAERRIKESETRYRLLAEYSTDMVFQLDRDLVRRYVSPACRDDSRLRAGGTGRRAAVDDGPSRRRRASRGDLPVRASRRHRARQHRLSHVAIATDAGSGSRRNCERSTIRTAARRQALIGALRDISQRKAAEDQLEEANRRLEALAGQDGLTGLANRRTFDDSLAREHRRAARDRSQLAMIMIDVDRFKPYNDHYGHPAGDEALRRVSRAIESTLRRPGDVAARYGGEEFAVLLPGVDESGAAIIADRIRRAVLGLAIEHDASPAGVVTISAGVASVAPGAFDSSLATLVADADRALYRAKANGRNAIVYASTLADSVADGRSSAA